MWMVKEALIYQQTLSNAKNLLYIKYEMTLIVSLYVGQKVY